MNAVVLWRRLLGQEAASPSGKARLLAQAPADDQVDPWYQDVDQVEMELALYCESSNLLAVHLHIMVS